MVKCCKYYRIIIDDQPDSVISKSDSKYIFMTFQFLNVPDFRNRFDQICFLNDFFNFRLNSIVRAITNLFLKLFGYLDFHPANVITI
jgi:hypothetical protein